MNVFTTRRRTQHFYIELHCHNNTQKHVRLYDMVMTYVHMRPLFTCKQGQYDCAERWMHAKSNFFAFKWFPRTVKGCNNRHSLILLFLCVCAYAHSYVRKTIKRIFYSFFCLLSLVQIKKYVEKFYAIFFSIGKS